MNVRKFSWLVIFVVHDFEADEDMANLNGLINDEILIQGISDEHALLLVRKSILLKTKYRFRTRILQLKKRKKGKFKFVKIKKEEFDFHDQRSWAKLMKWVNRYYQADYICLNTISHGAGFGITDGLDNNNKVSFGRLAFAPANMREAVSNENKNFVFEKARDSFVIKPDGKSISCKSLQMLWISELSNALKAAYGKRKIDLLLFNNCYMQTYENAWMLSENIQYLIAAETEFYSYGFNYKTLLSNINAKADLKPEALVQTIIPDLKQKWREIGNGRLEDVSISILDLTRFNEIAEEFEVIARFLSQVPDNIINEIIQLRKKNIRTVTTKPSDGGSSRVITIDLLYFFQLMAIHFATEKNIVDAIDKLILLFYKCTIGIHVGKNMIAHDQDQANSDKYNAQGVAIFMPFDLEGESRNDIMNCAYFGRMSRTQRPNIKIPLIRFKKQSQWDDFIERLINLL